MMCKIFTAQKLFDLQYQTSFAEDLVLREKSLYKGKISSLTRANLIFKNSHAFIFTKEPFFSKTSNFKVSSFLNDFKKMLSLSEENIVNIIRNIDENDFKSLYSISLINKTWCRLTIPYLWKKPFNVVKNWINNRHHKIVRILL